MSDTTDTSLPKKYWIISGLSLLWYLFGLSVYLMSVRTTPEQYNEWVSSGQYSQGYVDYMQSVPAWATAAFAIATLSGVLASICLLFRRAWAVPLFMLALVSALVMYIHAYLLSGHAGDMPTSDYIVSAMVIAVAAFMIWFSRKKKGKGWLS